MKIIIYILWQLQTENIDNGLSSTLFKFQPKVGKFLSAFNATIPLLKEGYSIRPQKINKLWAENYEWLYGGVGYAGFNGAGCAYGSRGPNSLELLGGDEVGFFHPCFVGVQTDKRLFISDIGNDRILSVRLEYHLTKIIKLKN